MNNIIVKIAELGIQPLGIAVGILAVNTITQAALMRNKPELKQTFTTVIRCGYGIGAFLIIFGILFIIFGWPVSSWIPMGIVLIFSISLPIYFQKKGINKKNEELTEYSEHLYKWSHRLRNIAICLVAIGILAAFITPLFFNE